MRVRLKAIAAAGSAAALLLLSGAATASVVGEQTFYFYGSCADCTLNTSPPDPIATLVLGGGYVQGASLALEDLISFSYVGSNLVGAYLVTPDGDDGTEDAYGIYGAMDSTVGGKDFRVDFGDGLRFDTSASGAWYTCAPAPDGSPYYSGTCDYLNNNDFGRAGALWNGPGNQTVPEPASYALVALALAAGVRRRSAAIR